MMRIAIFAIACGLRVVACPSVGIGQQFREREFAFFESRIRPVLVDQIFSQADRA